MDILIGATIISVAWLGIAFAWRQSTLTTVSARNYNQATYYAQQALEQLKIYDGKTVAEVPDDTWSQPTFVFTKAPIQANGVIPAAGTMPSFSVSTRLLSAAESTALSASDKVNLKPVKATVAWQEPGGAGTVNQSISIVAYYYLK